jgi:Ca2+-binding RTX toxin-like protein
MATKTGTEGNDLLFDPTSESDLVLGLGGNDTLSGGSYSGGIIGGIFSGSDTLDGGEGDDVLLIGFGSSYFATTGQLLIGGNGNDLLNSAANGANNLQGDDGNDTLQSAGSGGTLQGNNGNDVFVENGLFLGNSANTLEGGAGDDIFDLLSKNTIDGGDGFDALGNSFGTYSLNTSDSTSPIVIDLDNIPFNDSKIKNVETAVAFAGGSGDDVLILSRSIADKLRTVDARDGNDLVTILGDAHASVNGGKGVDRLYGGVGVDILSGGDDDDFAYGGDGNDSIFGGSGIDNLEGNGGNDTIQGDDGDDGLAGQEGNDFLLGGNGNDRLYGWTGDDVLYGDDGNDSLLGGNGNDTLTGGAGADTFAFNALSVGNFGDLGVDHITDFQAGTDKILLDQSIFTALPDSLNATSFQLVACVNQAATSNGLVVYSQGQLFYNANGTAPGYGIGGQFVTFDNPASNISIDDIIITTTRLSGQCEVTFN